MTLKVCAHGFRVSVEPIFPLLQRSGIKTIDIAEGYVECPGLDLHTTPNACHDCIVYNNDGVPFLHCLHTSCFAVREGLNAAWYAAARTRSTTSSRQTTHGTLHPRQALHQSTHVEIERERKLAVAVLPCILEQYPWQLDAIVAGSHTKISLPVEQQWRYALQLFPPDDVIWIGRDKFDSGYPRHCSRFRTAQQWLQSTSCPGSFLCPNAFRPGVHARLKEHILTPRFLVVESDAKLNKDQVGSVFRWIERDLCLPLRAVIDSANKSLHGWFNYPNPGLLKKLRLWLPAMGCDAAMFTPNQPCRLPGAWRTETQRHQRLLYLG